jgi:hypothetical protein
MIKQLLITTFAIAALAANTTTAHAQKTEASFPGGEPVKSTKQMPLKFRLEKG